MCDGALSVVDMNYDMQSCTLTTFDCNTLVPFQRKMTMRGHGDRHERLKSAVKSEGKHTHAQSIFSLHYTSNMEFLKLYC